MWTLMMAGGWLMLPLILCSILTITILIERYVKLRKSKILPKQLQLHIGQDVHTALQQLQQSADLQKTALGRIFTVGYQARFQSEHYARVQMEVVAFHEIGALSKYIPLLGTISTIAPLLGLVGTVFGMIESFLIMDLTASTPGQMIAGVSQALMTTALGMLIAIPALYAYRYFQGLVNDYIGELEQQATLFHTLLFCSFFEQKTPDPSVME
ncbi:MULTISPECIES: MotA/TolQ/ExbB proton channel family protein [unclassified Acinetobacter]|uniref:MotA/TolQ/ExbB proton channel family protein n=1 Tax=unclassified Acinetobacter TaxID=196816 RepID=UPI002934733B|nr:MULTISPECIES: MotA/TolQ/ExbB proton channel family protein [unclassified Acinetobacter]WOE32055.1 MotA/TolQ/ExbB proton channel family protein [Acinetobacter sp. SAAs470]WOE37524.1 MotA/TolQ/ExbB proton channel family protein [Acinetobacter sp. SAAs474]